ncbi:MAG: ATP-binding cassette domain-containing protein [Leptospiraceae bacterium]|nr:ATP-binding cassette domain-containing protein [Leptospiraceae bacterium]
MLSVENLTRKFSSNIAVDNISFKISPGKITGLLGPNGAGKTTTMRLITGFLEPTSGSIYYDQKSIADDSVSIKTKLGYLPESAPLYPEMLVMEYLNYMADIRGVPAESKTQNIQQMIEVCELQTHIKMLIGNLSKGFKQRVALAGTLIHNPEIIILDEPTSGLDPNQISHIRNLIKNLGKQKTLILSTHILQEVEEICDDVIIINRGKIVANSEVSKLHVGNQVLLTLNTNLENLKKALADKTFESITPFQNEEVPKGFFSYLITLKEDKPELIFQKLSQSSYQVREMKLYKRSLESIFEELTKN